MTKTHKQYLIVDRLQWKKDFFVYHNPTSLQVYFRGETPDGLKSYCFEPWNLIAGYWFAYVDYVMKESDPPTSYLELKVIRAA